MLQDMSTTWTVHIIQHSHSATATCRLLVYNHHFAYCPPPVGVSKESLAFAGGSEVFSVSLWQQSLLTWLSCQKQAHPGS